MTPGRSGIQCVTSSIVSSRLGKYEVLVQLQRGGMAELMLGATAGPGGFRKYVVLKRILPEAAGDENFVRMFLDEARVTAAFSHPNICQTFDLGDDNDGGLYVALEFIAGQDLNNVVSACAQQQAVLPIGFSASVVHDCATALHYAHTFKLPNGTDSPVIHRDVAQKNIMVTYDGQVKLLDFGIAKARGALATTRAGTVKGTAGYMSPEQVRGEQIDGRSDVFALGVVLWEMVTGQRLFAAETELQELKMILSEPIRAPHEVEPSVPVELSEVTMRALERDVDARYGSAREFARALATQCARLMFDSEERAEFMRDRFASKIASTQRLFDVAASDDEGEVLSAINHFRHIRDTDQGVQAAAVAKPRAKAVGGSISDPRLRGVSQARLKAVTGKPRPSLRLPKVVDDGKTEAVGAALVPPPEISFSVPPDTSPKSKVVPIVVGLVIALAVGAAVFFAMQHGIAEEPPIEDPGLNEPIPLAPPPEPIEPVPEVEVKPEPTPTQPVTVRAKGEVSLVLIPEATVMKGSQKLASGTFVNFPLPVGTHLLTVVGNDGIRRKLSVKVTAGKNKQLRLRLDDIPVE